MATTFSHSGRNGAAIGRRTSVAHAHPVHAMLSAYPLALFSTALVTDIAYANSAQMQWANFSVWLITGGLIMGALAAVAGIVDALLGWRRGGRVRRGSSWPHAILTGLMLLLALVNAFVHSRDGWTSVVPGGLVLSVIVTVLALITSWQGFALQAQGETR